MLQPNEGCWDARRYTIDARVKVVHTQAGPFLFAEMQAMIAVSASAVLSFLFSRSNVPRRVRDAARAVPTKL